MCKKRYWIKPHIQNYNLNVLVVQESVLRFQIHLIQHFLPGLKVSLYFMYSVCPTSYISE